MEKLLTSKYQRTIFLIVSFSLLTLIELMRFFVIPFIFKTQRPTISDAINLILDNLFATSFVTISIAILVFVLTPKIMYTSKMDVLEPHRIGEFLKNARDTDEYWFSGSSGRYTRAVTLPELAKSARASNFTKKIVIQILDPMNTGVCQHYVDYRRRVRSGLKGEWSLDRAKKDIYASIVAAYSWRAEQPLLDITIGLKSTVSIYRIDLSTKLVVITKEDPTDPALTCDAGTFFHRSFDEELRFSLSQSKVLSKAVQGIPFKDLNEHTVANLLRDLEIYEPSIDESVLKEIAAIEASMENRYE